MNDAKRRSNSPKTACIRYNPGCRDARWEGMRVLAAHPASAISRRGASSGQYQSATWLADGLARSAGDSGRSNHPARSTETAIVSGNLRPDKCWPSGIVPKGIRQRYGTSGTYRRRSQVPARRAAEAEKTIHLLSGGKSADRAGAIDAIFNNWRAVSACRQSRCADGRTGIGYAVVKEMSEKVHLYHPVKIAMEMADRRDFLRRPGCLKHLRSRR